MERKLSNKDLLGYLKTLDFNAGFIDRLKVYYRPIVCPFVDLISLVNPGEKVGDIGCGSGQFCLLLSEFAKPSFVYGIEINDRLVNNSKKLFERYSKVQYEFEKFDGVHFSEKIRELDVVFLNDVLHHVPKPSQHSFISDLIDKMKIGSRLIIKDINGKSLFVYFNKMHDLLFAGEIGNEVSYKTTQTWLQEKNLQIVQLTKKQMYVYPHYTIVAKKL